MTRIAFFFESLGFGLLAALVAGAFVAGDGGGEGRLPLILALVAGLGAAPVWALVQDRRGPIHPGMAVLAGVLAVVAAYGLGALALALHAALDTGMPPETVIGGAMGFAFFGLLLTGIMTMPLGVGFALGYGILTRLWRTS
jgi:hypothetical protein